MPTAGRKLLLLRQLNEFTGSAYKVRDLDEMDAVTRRFLQDFLWQWGQWREWNM